MRPAREIMNRKEQDKTHRDTPEWQLYDLQNDPYEFHNLAGQTQHAAVETRLRAQSVEWRTMTKDPLLDPVQLTALTKMHDESEKCFGDGARGRGHPNNSWGRESGREKTQEKGSGTMTATLSRRRFIEATSATLASATVAGVLGEREASAAPLSHPNIVFFIADDLGWGDLACYGHPYVLTPNADRLARGGTRFTGYYANHAVCSPSRAALMTGHFPARHRVHGVLPEKTSSPVDWLDASLPTLPRLLQGAGYATAHYGKWHLGSAKEAPRVTDYGFDDHRGTLSNGPGLWDTPEAAKDPYPRSKATGRIVDLGLDFIRRRGDKPFYLHLASLVPHHPLKPTP